MSITRYRRFAEADGYIKAVKAANYRSGGGGRTTKLRVDVEVLAEFVSGTRSSAEAT